MSYLEPSVFVPKIAEIGQRKLETRFTKTLVKSFMAGAILALAAMFAVTISVQTGIPLIGAVLFPVGFCLLYLMGFDLLTGVFVITPLAYLDRRPGVTFNKILINWSIVFVGNFLGALTVAFLSSIIFTFGFSTEPNQVGQVIAKIGVDRTLGYKEYGIAGMITIFTRGIFCNWMVSLAVVGSVISTNVSGKVMVMWMPIMLFFAMGFEHSIVNMYLFPTALMLGGDFSVSDYLIWNELPVVIGNLLGGILLTGLPLWLAHSWTRSKMEKNSTLKTVNI